MTDDSQTTTQGEKPLSLPPNALIKPLSVNSPIHTSEPEGLSPPKTSELSPPLNRANPTVSFAQQTHSYMSDYIKLADQKAAFFFATTTGLIALLYKDQSLLIWVVDPRSWNFHQLVAFVATLALSIQAFMCLFTTVPRLKGSKRGFLYFMAVAEYPSSEQYASDAMKLTESDIIRTWFTHSHELALIAKKKYEALSFAMKAGAVGTIASLILVIFH